MEHTAPAGRATPSVPPRVPRPTSGPRAVLGYPEGDIVVVSGLPGSGKSTLIRRAVPAGVTRVDSQDMRERWEEALGPRLPYAVYRPLVRIAHYAALGRALHSGASVVVHDCGTMAWVRRWIAFEGRRRRCGVHVLVLDVSPEVARAGQLTRGRAVSRYAFARHRKAVGQLVTQVREGELAESCASALLLDRRAASTLRAIRFERSASGDGGVRLPR